MNMYYDKISVYLTLGALDYRKDPLNDQQPTGHSEDECLNFNTQNCVSKNVFLSSQFWYQ